MCGRARAAGDAGLAGSGWLRTHSRVCPRARCGLGALPRDSVLTRGPRECGHSGRTPLAPSRSVGAGCSSRPEARPRTFAGRLCDARHPRTSCDVAPVQAGVIALEGRAATPSASTILWSGRDSCSWRDTQDSRARPARMREGRPAGPFRLRSGFDAPGGRDAITTILLVLDYR